MITIYYSKYDFLQKTITKEVPRGSAHDLFLIGSGFDFNYLQIFELHNFCLGDHFISANEHTNRQTNKPTNYQHFFGVVETSRSAGQGWASCQ